MLDKAPQFDLTSLRQCISAGEHLPLPTFEAWQEATGIRIINGIGTTEMLHIFISAAGEDIRPGATGKPIPGYQAMVVDDHMNPLAPGEVGKLAVRGPTGCRYLADERQTSYVVDGWNLTGDAYKTDGDGYFWFQARTDDMIISSGYNISGPEVEEALMAHDLVQDCAVVAAPDEERGSIVKAFVIPRSGNSETPALIEELQVFVKNTIAPYKYPRSIVFVDNLPRTETGKIQRFKLRRMGREPASRAAAVG
jgi:2-aminobenzoate-CoA ligase